MAKKKTAAGKRKSAAAKKKPGKKSAAKSVKKKAAKKKATKKKAAAKKKKKAVRAKTAQKKTSKSLGRARVPGHSRLDVLFQKDYQARELFEFLRVATLKELEEHGPDEIIERMTRPVVQTVDRIRKALALNNRALKDDESFALEFLESFSSRR